MATISTTQRGGRVRRGCGYRRPGVYVESRRGWAGIKFLDCLVDPPDPVPPELDIVNKAKVWADPDTGIPHLWSWVGENHYPYVWDIIFEIGELGASRRINPKTPGLDTLIAGQSRLILVHPKCLNRLWREQQVPDECEKHLFRHDAPSLEAEKIDPLLQPEERRGPCLFQTRNLIPISAAKEIEPNVAGNLPLCRRKVGATTIYSYFPTGEDASGLEPGIFAALPLTRFALVQTPQGDVHQGVKTLLEKAGIPFYETPY
jgi:hypothetical protein